MHAIPSMCDTNNNKSMNSQDVLVKNKKLPDRKFQY